MGLFGNILRKMPGSPVSAAKTMNKIFNGIISNKPDCDRQAAFRQILETRYQVMKTMSQSEIDMCLYYCSDLGEVVFWALSKENPVATSQPHVKDTVNSPLKKGIANFNQFIR